jgi:hypothetical protein
MMAETTEDACTWVVGEHDFVNEMVAACEGH